MCVPIIRDRTVINGQTVFQIFPLLLGALRFLQQHEIRTPRGRHALRRRVRQLELCQRLLPLAYEHSRLQETRNGGESALPLQIRDGPSAVRQGCAHRDGHQFQGKARPKVRLGLFSLAAQGHAHLPSQLGMYVVVIVIKLRITGVGGEGGKPPRTMPPHYALTLRGRQRPANQTAKMFAPCTKRGRFKVGRVAESGLIFILGLSSFFVCENFKICSVSEVSLAPPLKRKRYQ